MGFRVWLTSTLAKVFVFRVLREDGTVNNQLVNMLAKMVPAEKKSRDGVYTVDITIDAHKGVWCRVFVPTSVHPDKNQEKLPIMIYFHGGGFVLYRPDLKEYDSHCRHLSKMCQAIVISVSYRRAPEHKYPAAYEDGLMALQWVRSQVNEPNEDFPFDLADFSQVFVAGDSAGGNLAHHVGVKAGAHDISSISIAGLILIQPFFGGVERTGSEIQYRYGKMCQLGETDWYWRAFLPPGADRDHPSCNVSGPKSPAFFPMNVPKMLVVAGGEDPLRDRQIQYAEGMQSAGKDCKLVIYEKAFHGFYAFGGFGATKLLHGEIEKFVNPPRDDRKNVAGTVIEAVVPRPSTSFLDKILSTWNHMKFYSLKTSF